MTSKSIEQAFQFCPQCGAKNPEPGTVPFRCAECGYASFFGPVAAVGALVINDDNQLLLVRRARNPGKGQWGLPGGFVDRAETVEEAMAREVLEETQLKVIESQYLMTHPNHYEYRGIVAPVIDLFYSCRVETPANITLAIDELDYHEWMRPGPADLDQMAFHSNRLAVEYWLSIS